MQRKSNPIFAISVFTRKEKYQHLSHSDAVFSSNVYKITPYTTGLTIYLER